ncbi:MAG: PHP domain-containing protein [Deltaproteobacteria bacterium]|jgi:predicted metal-dependent phosphoesterase TrpH|nr:PHP domain-containing protein [Deltaproteobacteria bacterium]
MLTYMRNKLVNIEIPADDIYVAYGFLDDHIYSLETTFQVNGADLTIKWLKGHWNRYTTPDCPLAEEPLQGAVGLCLTDEGFNRSIHRIVGRKACRHFANLILECCDAIVKTKQMIENPEKEPGEIAETSTPESKSPRISDTAPVRIRKNEKIPFDQLEKAPHGFNIDLHMHTSPASACASSPVDEMIEEAKRIGLDGICLTDHNYRWDPKEIQRLRDKHQFLVLSGNEITTVQGDIVVFGLDEDIQGIIALKDLAEKVAAVDGFMIAAHPFRGFLAVSGDKLGLDVDRAANRPMFSLVNGVETLNSKVTMDENRFCGQVAKALNLPATGGSDAHLAGEVGVYATKFSRVIKNEEELMAALRAGDGVPVDFRNNK